ncbi:MAG: SRPBCC family protein [Ilumatobacteraceae bacterium]
MPAEPIFILDGRPTVRVERHYPHPIEKVWRAVTTPEHLEQWFPSPVDIDLRTGGSLRFGAFGGTDGATGIIEMVDVPRRLMFTWGADQLTFELTSEGDGTKFALTHSFDDRCGAPSFATGWELCMAGLRSLLAGEPLPPADSGIARHEELVHEFGLDQPQMTESDGGWTMRVERQLMCPAAVAWDLWFGKDRDTGEQRATGAVGHLAASGAEWAMAQPAPA